MLGILGESPSDVDTLTVLVRREAGAPNLRVKAHRSFDGCGDVLRRGARVMRLFAQQGCERFVICCDSDRRDPAVVAEDIRCRVVAPSGLAGSSCIVVPVREMESWIIADASAVQAKIPSFAFQGHPQPESLPHPKEWLINASRVAGGRQRYFPSIFNAKIAEVIDLLVLSRKCGSYRPLKAAIANWYPVDR